MSLSFANVRQFDTAKTTPGSGAKWNSFIVELIHQSLPHAASVEGVPRKKNDVLSWMSGWLEKIWAEPKKGMAEWMCGRFSWWVRVSGLGQCGVCCVVILYGLCARY